MNKPDRFYFVMVMTFLVVLLGYFSYEILRRFLYTMAWAAVLSILFYPLHAFTVRHTKKRSLSAFVVLGIALLILIGPAFHLTSLFVKEVASLSYLLDTGRIDALRNLFERPIVRTALAESASLISMSEDELVRAVMNYVAGLGRGLIAGIAKEPVAS